MTKSNEKSARRMAALMLGSVALCVLSAPSAHAAPCTASGLATTASGVLGAAGPYLDAHPGANDVLTAAANEPPDVARTNVRNYFTSHPGEFLELRNIAQPLKDLRSQCGITITPSQLATLLETVE